MASARAAPAALGYSWLAIGLAAPAPAGGDAIVRTGLFGDALVAASVTQRDQNTDLGFLSLDDPHEITDVWRAEDVSVGVGRS